MCHEWFGVRFGVVDGIKEMKMNKKVPKLKG
jgi:hypothetical protein